MEYRIEKLPDIATVDVRDLDAVFRRLPRALPTVQDLDAGFRALGEDVSMSRNEQVCAQMIAFDRR